MPSLPNLLLRALSPRDDAALFRVAYEWRSSPRRNRMSFTDFSADDPTQIVMGLFTANGNFIAVFMFHQSAPDTFDAHFSSSREADPADVLAAARWLVQWFVTNNLTMLAYIDPRQRPLAEFVLAAGLYDYGIQTLKNGPTRTFSTREPS